MEDLMSVIVLCYHKFEFIYAALDSVFEQSYSKIELIVSDDGSSNFPEDEICKYISKNKKKNIINVIINHEKNNLGTVKHLNHAVSLSSGDYIVALAADDVFYDRDVLHNYIRGFSNAKEECYIEMAQTAMCNYELKVEGYYLQSNVKAVLEKPNSGKELFGLLAFKPYLPSTSTCFKKSFFERFGLFDEKYKLIEDVPMHLRLAREGWHIHYENFVAVKHRTGGISHGSIGGLSKSQQLYYQDWLNILENEIIPYYDFIEPDMRKNVKRITEINQIWFGLQLASEYDDMGKKFELLKKHPGYFLKSWLTNKRYIFSHYANGLFKLSWFVLFISPIFQYILYTQFSINYTNTVVTWIVMFMVILALCFKGLGLIGNTIIKAEGFSDHFLAIG